MIFHEFDFDTSDFRSGLEIKGAGGTFASEKQLMNAQKIYTWWKSPIISLCSIFLMLLTIKKYILATREGKIILMGIKPVWLDRARQVRASFHFIAFVAALL